MLGNQALADFVRRRAFAVTFVLFAGAVAGDYVTNTDIVFTLLYLLPISIATWFRGRRFGLMFAVAAAAVGAWSAISGGARPLSVAWNQLGAFGIFLVTIQLLGRLRAMLEDERAKRGAAMAQLRHAERLNVIGTLAAGVAHELGTPLNVIAGNAELIDARNITYERVHRASEAILQQTRRMSTIISHLLDFGRRGGANRELTDVGALVTRSAALLDTYAARTACVILRPESPPKIEARVNRSEIEQVLANLVVNAIQASPQGGSVRLGCERHTQNGRPFVAITVEDEGSGIAPENLPRIFDPFFTTKDVGQGTGLGLSVSFGIVEDHGGSIHVKSERGRGSRFVVELPLDVEPSEAKATRMSA